MITKLFDRAGNQYEVGQRCLGQTKLVSIEDVTYWSAGANGWRGGFPCFRLSFEDGTVINIYAVETIFVVNKPEAL